MDDYSQVTVSEGLRELCRERGKRIEEFQQQVDRMNRVWEAFIEMETKEND